jgi:hypothetical protein
LLNTILIMYTLFFHNSIIFINSNPNIFSHFRKQ